MAQRPPLLFDTAVPNDTGSWGPQGPWFREPSRLKRRVAIGTAAVLLSVGGGWAVDAVAHACGSLNSGVTKIEGECIGVTDSSFVFNEKFRTVQGLIRKENLRIAGRPAVTVGLLNPWTPDPSSQLDERELRRQLEGYYTAQYWLNHTNPGGTQLKLVLANQGGHYTAWRQAVQQLTREEDAEAPLVGVAGMGMSVTASLESARLLSREGIPMIGVINSADQLNYKDVPGFFRVLPPVSEYVASLRHYLRGRPDLDSALLVADSNADSGDLFVRSAQDAFTKQMSGLLTGTQPIPFTGSIDPRGGQADVFTRAVDKVCQLQPKVVLFAGRQEDLKVFIARLAHRSCPGQVTIMMAGSDISAFATKLGTVLTAGKIDVIYAADSNVRGWTAHRYGPDVPPGFRDFLDQYQLRGFSIKEVTDTQAIHAYDALMTVARAVELAIEELPAGSTPNHRQVSDQLGNLDDLHPVRAASGTLQFVNRGISKAQLTGNPYRKLIPVLKIPGTGAPLGERYWTQ